MTEIYLWFSPTGGEYERKDGEWHRIKRGKYLEGYLKKFLKVVTSEKPDLYWRIKDLYRQAKASADVSLLLEFGELFAEALTVGGLGTTWFMIFMLDENMKPRDKAVNKLNHMFSSGLQKALENTMLERMDRKPTSGLEALGEFFLDHQLEETLRDFSFWTPVLNEWWQGRIKEFPHVVNDRLGRVAITANEYAAACAELFAMVEHPQGSTFKPCKKCHRVFRGRGKVCKKCLKHQPKKDNLWDSIRQAKSRGIADGKGDKIELPEEEARRLKRLIDSGREVQARKEYEAWKASIKNSLVLAGICS